MTRHSTPVAKARLKAIDDAQAKLAAEKEAEWRRAPSRTLVAEYNDASNWLQVSREFKQARIWEHDVLQIVKRMLLSTILTERFGNRWYQRGVAVVPATEEGDKA